MTHVNTSSALREAMAAIDGALLVLRTVVYRMVERRIFGKRLYLTIAVLGLGAFSFALLYKKRIANDSLLLFLPIYAMGVCMIAAVAICAETAWFVARLRTQPSSLQLRRLDWSMSLAVLIAVAGVGLLNQVVVPLPPPFSLLWIGLLPVLMFVSLIVLIIATTRKDRVIACALIAAILFVQQNWVNYYPSWRYSPAFELVEIAWLAPVCRSLWMFIVVFSARGMTYGLLIAVGVTAFERQTGVQLIYLCQDSGLLRAFVLALLTGLAIAVVVQGRTASRFRRWGLATLTMRDLSSVNRAFNAIALDPQRRIEMPGFFLQGGTQPLASDRLPSVIMRRAWTRSLLFAPALLAALVISRVIGGDQTVDPLNAVAWGIAASVMPMLVTAVNVLCLTTDRHTQNLMYLMPGWPAAPKLNQAIARYVVYGALGDAAIVACGFLAMLPFSVNPQYWVIAIASGLSAGFISVSFSLHVYLRENPRIVAVTAASSAVCLVPAIALLYLLSYKADVIPISLGLIVITATIAAFRVWRFERGESAIPVGLRYRS